MFWDNFNALCKSVSKSPNKIAQELSIASGSITEWKKGRIPSQRTLKKLADYFGVTIEYFFVAHNENEEIPGTESVEVVYFPIIGSVKAGYGCEAIEEDTGDIYPIPLYLLKGRTRNDFFVLKVNGDSMFPKLLDGDKVLVLRTPEVDSGHIAVVLYNGDEATIKKISYEPGCNYLDLIPLNPKYEPMRIKDEELNDCRILGQVISLFRDMGF